MTAKGTSPVQRIRIELNEIISTPNKSVEYIFVIICEIKKSRLFDNSNLPVFSRRDGSAKKPGRFLTTLTVEPGIFPSAEAIKIRSHF